MAVFFNDTFTDTNGTGLGSHTPDTGTGWSNNTSWNPSSVGAIQANNLYGGITNCMWYCDAATGGTSDYRVSCNTDVQAFGGNVLGCWLVLRMGTTTQDGYFFQVSDSGGNFRLACFKYVSGSATTLVTVTTSVSYGDCYMEFEVEGTNLTCYCQNAATGLWFDNLGATSASKVACISTTDGSLAGPGRPGINPTNSLSTTRTHVKDFTAETLSNEFTESVTSTLSMVGGVNETEEAASNTMLLASGITFFNVVQDRQVPENTLNLVQTVELQGLIRGIGSTLSLSGVATNFLLDTQTPSSNLGLTQEATVVFGVPHAAPWGVGGVSQSMSLTGGITNIADRVGSSTLTLTGEAIASYGLSSDLGLAQSVSGGVGNTVEQDLGISQTVSRGTSEWTRSVAESMSLTSAGNGWNGNDKCFRRNGEGGTPSSAGKLTLFSKDGLYSIILRNPENDNTRRVAFDRVLRETRGGNLTVYRDQSWNVVQTLLFTIVALKRSTLDDLQTFFLNTLGQEISLVDWLGEEWSGVVTRPDEVATEDRDGWWTIAFEFEGSKLDSSGTWQNLNLSSFASATVVP